MLSEPLTRPSVILSPGRGQELKVEHSAVPWGEGCTIRFAILPSSHNPLPSRERVPEERGRVRGLDANDARGRIR